MYTRGEYRCAEGTYGLIMKHTKQETEIILVSSGEVCSAYKKDSNNEFSFINNKAKKLYGIIHDGLVGCKAKNGVSVSFDYGASVIHQFTKKKLEYAVELFNNEIVGLDIQGELVYIQAKFEANGERLIPSNIPYIVLTKSELAMDSADGDIDVDAVRVRSVQEIALEKEDITWLHGKKYYIVNDDEQAEQLFAYLDNYNGAISYDTETTGLKINCFGKINSSYQKTLEQYNKDNPDNQIRADRLVGIIFCVENDVSYYFPCFNRKFKNLYSTETDVKRRTVENIKARYTVGEFRDKQSDMADYVRNTPYEQWSSDVILMERVRNILEKRHIVAHNGSFEWKVSWLYEILVNLKDDTMILHQIMYKFRTTTSNRGEPSNLKYLSKVELGMDQWELSDFFPDFKEDKGGEVRGKKSKKGRRIDFSYMDYDGTKVYAPADGDATFQLFIKYKRDMLKNHKELEYIYNVEVVVASAIGYMEFYGHRIDEDKISAVRDQTKASICLLESKIRQAVGYSSPEEIKQHNLVEGLVAALDSLEGSEKTKAASDMLVESDKLQKIMDEDEQNPLNLASPSQVATLFYDVLNIPFTGEKRSVAKKEIKSLLKARDENGAPKYPVVHLYSEYKAKDTLMTKFFDNLPNYMYPGGFIFSHFGQISTATGRMSCSKPNVQQYPKAVTNIVVPRDGYVMADADYSQIEYRVLVALAGETKLAELFSDPDSDYHTLMASLMYSVDYASVTPKMRGDAKSFNFGIPYGMGYGSLAILLTGVNNASTRAEAAEKYELYFKDQPRTRKFFDQVKEMAQVNKYTKTFWNRYRYYSFTDADGNVDNAKKAAVLRQAGNSIIQGSAADIFKISVARNYMYIKENGLVGDLLIINMVHDEQLFELNVNSLNIQRVLRDIGINMQFKVEGFPPLYIGAGLGPAWAKAKGKMAEIHPLLLNQLSEEAANMPIRREGTEAITVKEVLDYFSKRVLDFRRNKVKEYLTNPENFGQELHPAIGNLINLQFSYGHDKEKEGLSDSEFTTLCVSEFIRHENLEGIDASMFRANKEQLQDVEEDEEYEDEDDLDLEGDNEISSEFTLVDESDKVYGASIYDLIKVFGFFVSQAKGVCGIDLTQLGYKKKEELVDYLSEHSCTAEDSGAMEIIFMQEGNVLNRTGVYVNGIEGNTFELKWKEQKLG